MSAEEFDLLVGRYQLAPNFVMTVSREGDRFFVQATHQPKIELFPESKSKFFAKIVNAQISFGKNNRGEIDHLILHQGGAEQKGSRLEEDSSID